MKKEHKNKKSSLTLRREHIRVLTPTDLHHAVGGAATKHEPTSTAVCHIVSDVEVQCH